MLMDFLESISLISGEKRPLGHVGFWCDSSLFVSVEVGMSFKFLMADSIIFFLFFFSVNLLDTSTSQNELGWLPDPPDSGVSRNHKNYNAVGLAV